MITPGTVYLAKAARGEHPTMQAMICDACRRPMEREGFELSLLRAAVVHTPGEIPHLTNITGNNGVHSASLCLRCV